MANSTIQKENDLYITRQYVISTGYIAAGTIGTRGAQQAINIQQDFSGYYIVSTLVIVVPDSSVILPYSFIHIDSASVKLYLNIYRATSSAISNQNITVRVTGIRSDVGQHYS